MGNLVIYEANIAGVRNDFFASVSTGEKGEVARERDIFTIGTAHQIAETEERLKSDTKVKVSGSMRTPRLDSRNLRTAKQGDAMKLVTPAISKHTCRRVS